MLCCLCFCILSILLVANMYITLSCPNSYSPKGKIWPKPRQQKSEDKYLTYDPFIMKVKVTSQTCTILENAIQRYTHLVQKMMDQVRTERRTHGIISQRNGTCALEGSDGKNANFMGNLIELHLDLAKPCENYPYLEMDERYTLEVNLISNLKSNSIWGILRGLETFSQLFYISDDFNEVRINKTSILDYPRYPHRGLLLDTARNYIPLETILIILDGMTMNKMNVLHWHIVDDESFPYQSEKFPELSKKGAFAPNMIYSTKDVRKVINYARDRGIRVIPEFDVPGHTKSWGAAFPKVLTLCYSYFKPTGFGPMDPFNNATYKLINELFGEVQDMFPDRYFHVGGDEVGTDCWKTDPMLLANMDLHNIRSVESLYALFMSKIFPMLNEKSKLIVWQEVFDNNVPLPYDTVVQVWKDYEDTSIGFEMQKILKAGKKVLYSSTAWYLDYLRINWQHIYRQDPRVIVGQIDNPDDIIGGEACMWSEEVKHHNVVSSIWPRASAVAERLWSEPAGSSYRQDMLRFSEEIPPEVYHRLEEHTCRMITRGVGAQPIVKEHDSPIFILY